MRSILLRIIGDWRARTKAICQIHDISHLKSAMYFTILVAVQSRDMDSLSASGRMLRIQPYSTTE
jgi:hypothetical protein